MKSETGRELTDEEIKRIDFVQNETFEYLKRLLPADKAKKLEFDTDMLTYIAESVAEVFDEKGLMSESECYPYVDSDDLLDDEDDEG